MENWKPYLLRANRRSERRDREYLEVVVVGGAGEADAGFDFVDLIRELATEGCPVEVRTECQ